MGVRSNLVEWTPFIAMVTVECLNVGLSTLSKAAMSRGVNHFVLVVYSNVLATLILLPSSFFIDRTRPSLSFSLLCKFFLLGILGITVMQNCVFIGINYSSPTLGSTMSNLSPAITFVLAVTLRMEKLNIRSSISQIKVMGAVLSISGALVVTFYKGSSISTFRIQPSLLAETNNWVIGGLVFAMASVSFAAWNITQAIAGSVVTFSVTAWCIKRKGPVFVSMFKPAGIALAAFSSVAFLGETLHVGR
ncbi:Auxin-induced protein 5NG4 [Glycine soja]|nr:Auxin-induced protein 5NG4 [Glycine soja]